MISKLTRFKSKVKSKNLPPLGKEQGERLLARIKGGAKELLPEFSGAWERVSEVKDWTVYLVHDPCHDRGMKKADRWTVIALHDKGRWVLIGRELDHEYALSLALGER